MIGEGLGYKQGVVERAEFEYFPLGQASKNRAKNKINKIIETD